MRLWLAIASFLAVSLGSAAAIAAELSFWSWRMEDKDFYEAVAKDYEARTGQKIVFTPFRNTEYPTILSATLASGAGPDIIHARAYGALAALADNGFLTPLTKTAVPNLASFPDERLAAAKGRKAPFDRNVYGVPSAIQSLGLFYNTAVLKQAGVEALPKTWDEFRSLCRNLKAKNLTCIANGSADAAGLEQMFGVIAPNFYGSSAFAQDIVSGARKFTDPGFVKALEETAAMKEFMPHDHPRVGEDEARTLFANNLAAFYFSGTWTIATLEQLNPDVVFSVMPPLPLKADGPVYVPTFIDGHYAVNARTKYAREALDFLNYLASEDFAVRFARELKQVPALPGVSAADDRAGSLARMAERHGTSFIMLEGFRYQNPTGSALLREGLQRLMQGRGAADAVALEVQSRLQSSLNLR